MAISVLTEVGLSFLRMFNAIIIGGWSVARGEGVQLTKTRAK